MKILVIGGTGTVGSQVVRELSSRGADISVLTRDPAKAKDLPTGVKEHFQKTGLKASAEAVARQTRLIGHAPRSFDAFAKETAAIWKSRGAAGA